MAVPDQSDSLPDREHGAFADTGQRQTEVVEAGRWGVAGGWRYYLWSWVNPRPEHDLARIEVEAREAVVEVGGLCLGFADEHPLQPEPARVVVADTPAGYTGDGLDLALEVDRGTAGYTTPLVRQPDTGDPFSAWGMRLTPKWPAYTPECPRLTRARYACSLAGSRWRRHAGRTCARKG